MQAFKVRHFGGVSGFHQGFESGFGEGAQSAAEDDLLAEEVGFGFLLKVGLDDSGASAADGRGVREGDVAGFSGFVLVDGDEAGDAAAGDIG